jgi:magnesium transporter
MLHKKTPHVGSRAAAQQAQVGLSPGTLIHIGLQKVEEVTVRLWEYDEHHCKEFNIGDTEGQKQHKLGSWWIEVTGLHETQLIDALCRRFHLHPLLIEDILNTEHHPKFEEYDNALFVVLKLFTYNEQEKNLETEQISIVFGDRFIISFQEKAGDPFEPIRDRLRTGKGRLRKNGVDELAHRLMDAVVDSYYLAIARIGKEVEELEETMMDTLTDDTVQDVYRLKQELLKLRRFIWPLRDVVGRIERSETPFLKEETIPYLRDLQDHIIQVNAALEMFRDMVGGLLDAHLSRTTVRMNEVMKTLTIIATIFIPLTFIVGIYGMNFRHMPELDWVWGYPVIWGIIIVVVVGMAAYFKKRGWF